jgi:opacity protein-like surface antigen
MANMHRTVAGCVLSLALLAVPTPAAADITAFLGFSTPESRAARGFAVGMNFLLVGVEFEYSNTRQKEDEGVPGLATSMFNGIVSTPTTGIQFYGTIGGGFYRERLDDETETSFGTNIGGGAKITLAGPLRLRIDYRVFNLRGGAQHKTPQRFYAGLNLRF